jgi:hypothetical protein
LSKRVACAGQNNNGAQREGQHSLSHGSSPFINKGDVRENNRRAP